MNSRLELAYTLAMMVGGMGFVVTEMVREGLNASDISTVGRNSSEPLVRTGSGLREPPNRRAVTDLGR